MGKLLDRATNIHQYDLEDLHWENEISLKAPTREFMYHYLSKYESLWKGSDILDLGSGTNWLLNEMKSEGARTVTGVDPSKTNYKIAKEHFPDIPMHIATIEEYETDKQYDLIVSVMVFCHLKEPSRAFRKIYDWLRPGGEFHLIVPGYEYNKSKRTRPDYQEEPIDDESFVAQVERSMQGVISDIIRKNEQYIKSGEASGLTYKETNHMKPTPYLLAQSPSHKKYDGTTMAELIRFTK
jgi:2-polyprenyl-3-methyl-5-hydroxy-6-metoxy-1,4-benzoquinol methylase